MNVYLHYFSSLLEFRLIEKNMSHIKFEITNFGNSVVHFENCDVYLLTDRLSCRVTWHPFPENHCITATTTSDNPHADRSKRICETVAIQIHDKNLLIHTLSFTPEEWQNFRECFSNVYLSPAVFTDQVVGEENNCFLNENSHDRALTVVKTKKNFTLIVRNYSSSTTATALNTVFTIGNEDKTEAERFFNLVQHLGSKILNSTLPFIPLTPPPLPSPPPPLPSVPLLSTTPQSSAKKEKKRKLKNKSPAVKMTLKRKKIPPTSDSSKMVSHVFL